MNSKKVFVTQSSMPPYEEYIEAIRPLWDNHRLTNMGRYHKELEEKLEVYLDVPNLSLMVNGHMALELTLQAFDFPEGAEIITTPFTFISTTHAIVRNHLQPVFCDAKLSDGTMDETKIEDLITEKTVAILPVHVYGNVCNVEEIQRIADKHDLKVIYDAAHAFGVTYRGRGIGNYGNAAIFSFHATKVFNTIEGGAVAFSDARLYDKLYNLKNFGIRGEELVVSVGTNAKLNEFCAIMGLCNLGHIDEAICNRRRVYERYCNAISDITGIRLFVPQSDVSMNYGYMPIIVGDSYPLSRDELYDRFQRNLIYTRKYFYPLTSDEICFGNQYRDVSLPVARELSSRILALPIYEGMTSNVQDSIIEILGVQG